MKRRTVSYREGKDYAGRPLLPSITFEGRVFPKQLLCRFPKVIAILLQFTYQKNETLSWHRSIFFKSIKFRPF